MIIILIIINFNVMIPVWKVKDDEETRWNSLPAFGTWRWQRIQMQNLLQEQIL
jgi:hypothetical protein